MQDSLVVSLLLVIIFLVTSCNNDCPKEDVADLKKSFMSDYSAWRASLDYLDDDVIQSAFVKMDSTLISMQECHTLPDEFKIYTDSVSVIYAQHQYEEDDFLIANQLLEKIEEMLVVN